MFNSTFLIIFCVIAYLNSNEAFKTFNKIINNNKRQISKFIIKNNNEITNNFIITNEDLRNTNNNNGIIVSSNDVKDHLDKHVYSIGMPRVIAPMNDDEEWLMWYHIRDESIGDNVLSLSTGRLVHSTSKDGINWKIHEDSPFMGPAKENGDW